MQEVRVETLGDARRIGVGGVEAAASGSLGDEGELSARLGERRLRATALAAGDRLHLFVGGRAWPLAVVDTQDVGAREEAAGGGLKAPMPGKVIALAVEPGSVVERGAPLLVMEAMKMEHSITAPARGVVKAFHFAPGDQVADGDELLDFEGVA